MAKPVGLPRPKDLRPDVLGALGELTEYTAGVSVSHHLVRARVMERRELDPANLPNDWVLKGYGGLNRKIDYAFRNSRAEFVSRPLTKQGSEKGEWQLTELGVHLAKQINGIISKEETESPLPTPSAFSDDVVWALGKLTKFNRKASIRCEEVVLLTIEKAGYDPDNLPDGWTLPGIRQKVHQAFRQQTDRCRKTKLLRGTPRVYSVYGKRGHWGLTLRGISRSKEMHGFVGKNETAIWLDKQGIGLIEKMRSAVGRRLPVSATMDLVDDHVNNFIVRLVRRDTIRKMRDKGKAVVPSRFVSYCVRSAFTDIRGWGTDAHCRSFRGARTEHNRRTDSDTIPERAPLPDDVVVTKDASGTPTFEHVDPDGGINEATMTMDLGDLRTKIVEDLQFTRPDDWESHVHALDRMIEGSHTNEIAAAQGVPYRVAAQRVHRFQRIARHYRNEGLYAL